jgi:hypothetical protein
MRYGASPIDESLLMEMKATNLHDNDHNQAAVDSGRIRSAGRAARASWRAT